MEIANWILLSALSGAALFLLLKANRLQKQIAETTSLISDLSFAQKDALDFLETHIARAHYDLQKRYGRLTFQGDMPLDLALEKQGAREVLIRRKMIRKKDEGPFPGTLAERAREKKLSLEPILVALNDLETHE